MWRLITSERSSLSITHSTFVIAIALTSSCGLFGQVPVQIVDLPKSYTFPVPDLSFTATKPNPQSTPTANVGVTHPGLTQKEHEQYIRAEVENYNKQQAYREQLLNDAFTEFERDKIFYEFEMAPANQAQEFYNAFSELKDMIEGKKPLDLKKAVFLVEHAYDSSLRLEDFNKSIDQAIHIVSEKMKRDKVNPKDNTAKVMGLFQFMSDTVTIYSPQLEKKITSYPKTYDFEDFWGRQDYRKMFVSKALKTGTGQCHSLPLLFLILCQEIGAEASLSFSPNHSFIKFQDRRGIWHNLELTNGMLASDHFMIQTGYVKAEALQSRIYLEPISKHRTIVQCLNDLALAYVKRFGYDRFAKSCTNLSLKYYDNDITAHQINANYYANLAQCVVTQYRKKGWNRAKLEQDENAMKILTSMTGVNKKIETLGYSDMPPEAYEAWLKSIQNEANKQQHRKELGGLNGMINRN